MLSPSTRATWKQNVTISVAYTAAEKSVCTPDRISEPMRDHYDVVATGSATGSTTDAGGVPKPGNVNCGSALSDVNSN